VPVAVGTFGSDRSSLPVIVSPAGAADVDVVAVVALAGALELPGFDDPHPTAISAQLRSAVTS
jgi:hypothetical protein